MEQQLVPKELLEKSNKILFITHLAIGDFTYLQNYFKAFSEQYPHMKIDLFVDEVRRTRMFWRWKYLKNYVLIDWLKACPFFNAIYFGAHSPARLREQVSIAQNEEYPIIISLCVLRSHKYAALARKISPKGFIAGVVDRRQGKNTVFDILDASLDVGALRRENAGVKHISDLYAMWFERLVNLNVSEKCRAPFVSIPREWVSYGKLKLIKWGIRQKGERFEKVVFINSFAKDIRRCWPIDRLVPLVQQMREEEGFEDAYFIINVIPEYYNEVQSLFSNYYLPRVFLFTADENFFQLPSIISLCDLVISVETSVIHLAAALHVLVVALMRTKNPEWTPHRASKHTII